MLKKQQVKGSWVAIVTPFSENGSIDFQALESLVEWHCQQGTNGIVVCGTTGETPTLQEDEYKQVISSVVKTANNRVSVMAGSGANDTKKAIKTSKQALECGVDALLIVTPYYNKPTQEGLYLHYKEVCQQVKAPIVLYNVPGRTGVNLLPDTVARLVSLPEIIGIKEACGNLEQIGTLIKKHGADLPVLSGDDGLTMPLMAIGATGVISVTANIFPQKMSAMVNAALAKDWDTAQKLHHQLAPINAALFWETSPAPVKEALSYMDKCSSHVRLPLCTMQNRKEDLHKLIKALMD